MSFAGHEGRFISSWMKQSCGSISCRRQLLVKLARIAAVRPPRGFPTNSEFLRFRTTRFISRSLTLLSMGTAPSLLSSAVQREVEHVVRICFIAYVHPHACRLRLSRPQHRKDRIVGTT